MTTTRNDMRFIDGQATVRHGARRYSLPPRFANKWVRVAVIDERLHAIDPETGEAVRATPIAREEARP